MINAIFIYNEQKILIQCNLEDKMRTICQKFAAKVDINVDSKIYLHNNKPLSINPELNKTFGQQIDSNDTNDKEIIVLDDPDKEYTIKLHFEGEVKEVKLKENENYESLFDKIGNYFSLKRKSFYALCNGVLIGDDDNYLNKSISQLTNEVNKETKEINLLIEFDELSNEESMETNKNNDVKNNALKNDENKGIQFIKNNNNKRAKFFLKIYLILLIQFLSIGLIVLLGFFKNFNKIFIQDFNSFILTSSSALLYIVCVGLWALKYKKNYGNLLRFFIIILFIPYIIIFCFLLSHYIPNKYILTILLLYILDIFSVIIFVSIFKRIIGYGVLFFTLISNIICMAILYFFIFYKEENLENINCISSLASVFIIYILFFNIITKKKLDYDELIVFVYYFDYSIFVPFVVTLFILVVLIILIPLSLIITLLIIVIALIIAFIILTFGTSFILIFMIFKIVYYLITKHKKNLNKKND